MEDKKLPIKFFAKREKDTQLVEGGGNSDNPKWVLNIEDAKVRSLKLSNELEIIENKFDTMKESFIPIVVRSKIAEDAKAKSHRKEIRKIFNTKSNNLIGLDNSEDLLIKIETKEDLKQIKDNINETEKNIYGISCIEDIKQYIPKIKIIENQEVSYKIKLIDYQNYELNVAVKKLFEKICDKNNIKYKKTEYTDKITIFKTENLTLDSIEKFKDEDIYNSIFSIEPMPRYIVTLDEFDENDEIAIKNIDKANKKVIIGVLDSGIEKIPHLEKWIVDEKYTAYPENVIDRKHGTFVSGIINYGDDLENKQYIGDEAYYLYDATVFPNQQIESIEEDELINNIKEAVKQGKDNVRIWNLSCGTNEECDEENFSDFGIALDELQDNYNVLICKSAGNCKNFIYGRPKSRISKSADSIRSIVVGSIANSKNKYDLAEENHPSPFTRIGRGPQFIIKPDLVHIGGNAGIDENGKVIVNGVKSFGIDGKINVAAGTSFSTPRITSLAAGLYSNMNEEFDSLLLKALIIHSCKYPDNINMPREEIINEYGYGMPKSVKDILYNSPNEVTLIMRDNISKGEYIDIFEFPMPECLIEDGYFKGQIVATLVYNPIIDPSQGGEYCQSNINVLLGTYDKLKERDTEKTNILNPVGRDSSQNIFTSSCYSKTKIKEHTQFVNERTLIEYKDKYYPVKKYAVDLSEFTSTNKERFLKSNRKWYLKVEGIYRDFVERKSMENGEKLNQEFCLIITLRDPSGKENVYDGVSNKLDEYDFWHNNIKIQPNIHIHNNI